MPRGTTAPASVVPFQATLYVPAPSASPLLSVRTTSPSASTTVQVTVAACASRNERVTVRPSASPSCGKKTAFDAATNPSAP